MKISIDRTDLASAVTKAVRALPQRPPVPVLAGLKLEAADGQLTVSGYDYDVSAQAAVSATIHTPGTVIVSGRLLADICKAVRGNVRLEQNKERLIVTSGSARFTLHLLPYDDYPALPDTPPATASLPGKLLHEAISQVAVAASRDDTLPQLTGVQVETNVKSGTVTFSVTDRYRFAVRTVPVDFLTESEDSKVLVPAKPFADAVKDLSGDATVTFAMPTDANVFGVSGEHDRTTLRVLDGHLPAYKGLFPTSFAAAATIETGPLKEAVKRVALVAERNTPVRLRFEPERVILQAGSSDDAQARETVPAQLVDGDAFDLALNPGYFLEGLDAIDSATLRIGANGPVKPALMYDADAHRDDGVDSEHLRYLIMPVRLAN
jgi:DNA polymerase III subunit beta